MYDLGIIGGGPAGTSAAVYAARKRLNTVLITEEFGGQSIVSAGIENWIGTMNISGLDLAKKFENHIKQYAGNCVDIKKGRVSSIKEIEGGLALLVGEQTIECKTLIFCAGSQRRKLEVKGADIFEHKGLTYCASCDGPLFADQDVVVIGGGNAGFETAAQLMEYAKSVTILQRSGEYRADKLTVDKVLENPKVTGIVNVTIKEVMGDQFISGIKVSVGGGDDQIIKTNGIFVEIGLIPSTEIIEGLVETDKFKRIVVDPRTQKTTNKNIWAAGDCTDVLYHQNNIASGDAVKAIENLYLNIKTR